MDTRTEFITPVWGKESPEGNASNFERFWKNRVHPFGGDEGPKGPTLDPPVVARHHACAPRDSLAVEFVTQSCSRMTELTPA